MAGLYLTVDQVLKAVLIQGGSLANLHKTDSQYRVPVEKECPVTG